MDTLEKSNTNEVHKDLIKSIGLNTRYYIWMSFLTLLLFICLLAYQKQLQDGLIVTGLRDYVSWGMYISNFVFFVAVRLVGMLVSAVLGLAGQTWVKPITRVSEVIALGFVMVAGLVIITDMGRPDRFLNIFLHGRLQSPIIWDVTVITTYVAISTLLFFLPLIPDLAFIKKRMKDMPVWQYQL